MEVHITKGPTNAPIMELQIPIPPSIITYNDPHIGALVLQEKGITTDTMRTIGEQFNKTSYEKLKEEYEAMFK